LRTDRSTWEGDSRLKEILRGAWVLHEREALRRLRNAAFEASNRDFRVVVIEDCVASM
jgi:hypothetical protein